MNLAKFGRSFDVEQGQLRTDEEEGKLGLAEGKFVVAWGLLQSDAVAVELQYPCVSAGQGCRKFEVVVAEEELFEWSYWHRILATEVWVRIDSLRTVLFSYNVHMVADHYIYILPWISCSSGMVLFVFPWSLP